MHVARPGGTIIMLSACEEGIGGAHFRELCRSVASPKQFTRDFVEGDRSEIDQWCVHNFTRALRKCDGVMIDRGLTDEERSIILPQSAATFEVALAAGRILHLARGLPSQYSEPLLLRAVRGLSQREIAETLQLPETTVETRLARARRMLRDELDREGRPEAAASRGVKSRVER